MTFTISTSISSTGTGGIPIAGCTDGSSASAGNVGQIISSSVGLTNFPTSNTFGDLTSISLTAGDWLICAWMSANVSTAAVTNFRMGISTNSGTSSAGLTEGDNSLFFTGVTLATGAIIPLSIPFYHVSISTTTTHYFKFESLYSSNQPQAAGRITAVRIR